MIGAIVGGTIGAMTTLLFNTQEGKKIQKRMMKKFHEMNKGAHFSFEKLKPLKKKLYALKRKHASRRKAR
jgi:gas vesicle protein